MYIRLLLTAFLFFAAQNVFSQIEKYRAAKENDNEIFIITADSVRHTGKKLSFPKSMPSRFIKLDGVKYECKKGGEILAYQDKDEYAVYIPGGITFAARYYKGKINLYTYTVNVYGGSGYESTSRWILEKQKGVYLLATPANMEIVFADNPVVMQKCSGYISNIRNKSAYFSSNRRKEESEFSDHIVELVELYNK